MAKDKRPEKNEEFDLNKFKKTKNSSKKNNKKVRYNKKGKLKKSPGEIAVRITLAVALFAIILVCIAVVAVAIFIANFDYEWDVDLNNLELNCTTTILVQDGEDNWVEYQRLHGGENRIWVSLDQIPKNLQNAFVAIEDKRFYTHGGVDWKRTTAALANYFLHFYSSNQGGSTITQQLVKNLTGDNVQDWRRKLREILRAREIEMRYSKPVILECYLNVVGMSNGISGVEVAANYYYGKNAMDLTLAECASIAAITKEPEFYRPDKQPENNLKRRNQVLYEMYDQGYISKEEYDLAVAEEMNVVANAESIKSVAINNYFVDAVIEQVVSDLQKTYNYEYKDAEMMFYNSGYKIYATMDKNIQTQVEAVYNDQKTYGIKSNKGTTMQGAITVMDYEGHVVGIAGGIGEKSTNRGFNRATQAFRQPGSTMKPVAAYAQALENNMITYSTLIEDRYVQYGSWYPKNWYDGFRGTLTMHNALECSVNTIPTFLVDRMTCQKSYDFLTQSLNYSNLTKVDSQSLAGLGMGGTNGGVSTMQSAAAYAIFGNGGRYYSPTTYYKVTDSKDNIILEYTDKGTQVISQDTATVMNYMLRNVVYGGSGTGAGARGYIPNMQIFAKTGTSDASNDLWFVGGSPYYVASAWAGYDENATIRDQGIAQRMWGRVMSPIHKNRPAIRFNDSKYTSTRYYCRETGLIATEGCTATAVGYYKNSYLPYCAVHGDSPLNPIAGTNQTLSGKHGFKPGKAEATVTIEPEEPSGDSSDTSGDTSSDNTLSTIIPSTPDNTSSSVNSE